MLPFRERLSDDQRRLEFSRISERLNSVVPVILERGDKDTPSIDREKYLVPLDLTMSQFAFVVRKRLKLRSCDALFLMVNRTLCNGMSTAHSVYSSHRNTDGFLYVTYTLENTFG